MSDEKRFLLNMNDINYSFNVSYSFLLRQGFFSSETVAVVTLQNVIIAKKGYTNAKCNKQLQQNLTSKIYNKTP